MTKGIPRQKWNGYRLKINTILGSFYAWVVNQKVNALEDRRKLRKFIVSGPPFVATIPWIEILLHTSMDGHRKFVMSRTITF